MLRPSPRLFVSYSRGDTTTVERLVAALEQQGFEVFQDTSGIDPGDNFVNTLLHEIRRSTAMVAVLSENYVRSRWAQAELYAALTAGKIVIPVVLWQPSLEMLDDPVRRLVRDTQYVEISPEAAPDAIAVKLVPLLARARRKHRLTMLSRALASAAVVALISFGSWWAVTNLNVWQARLRLDEAVNQVANARATLQQPRIEALAATVTGDPTAIGRFGSMAHDPALSDVARFNALMLSNEIRKGTRTYRWYVKGLDVERAHLDGAAFVETSFLGGKWSNVDVRNSTFSGVFWGQDAGTSVAGSTFTDVSFYGGDFEAINMVDVSFVNSKFRGTTIDTTNFAKVRFVTQQSPTEGTPLITPSFALFERSVIISRREPPPPNVIDLTQVGDDVVFDDVMFMDCRLEGWFRAEWFRRSSFERCVLPESLTAEALRKAGNNVDDASRR